MFLHDICAIPFHPLNPGERLRHKKYLIAAAAGALVLALTGCGQKDTPASGASGASATGSAAPARAADTMAKIKSRGVVNLGVRESSGLGYTLGNGKYVGFHTEMAERIVDVLY